GKVYPEGPWRPESSFQRGSVSLIQVYPGDPLTPGYAATKDAPRIDPKDAKNLNSIPSLPLSYRDAEPLLRALQGQGKKAADVGENWVGGLTTKGVEYWTGPSELSVNLLNKVEYKNTPIQNVIARIKGWDEPERAVIIGNHRDAWCAGASDPSSGSAALLELARGLGELQKLGWRPRRTIILASWDAEEYSLIGSTEWVEENIDWLRADAVAYVNVDGAVGGDFYAVAASPVFKDLLYEVTKQVPYPNTNETVYEAWLRMSREHPEGPMFMKTASKLSFGASDSAMEMLPAKGKVLHLRPKVAAPPVYALGSGSDFTAFMAHAGISSIDMGFGGYTGTYHSNYDSFKWMTSFIDPEMKLHQAMTRIWGLLTIKLADDPVLNLNPVRYAQDMKLYIKNLEEFVASQLRTTEKHQDKDIDAIIAKKFRHLRASQRQLLANARLLNQDKRRLRSVFGEGCQMTGRRRQASCRKLRKWINDRSAFLERHFIDPEGIPEREWYKHVLVSPGRWMGYGSQIFPTLSEASEDKDWRKFSRYEKRTAEIIYEAAWYLREV
ncbi:Vacuolar protein sorting-associated protein 70, partial [Dipsacomyces acuminosporus]